MFDRNKELSFNDFKNRALDNHLSSYEKIGFPETLRKQYTELIVSDINKKLLLEDRHQKTVFDIGCGCGKLIEAFIQSCKNNNHKLILLDSAEMLNQIPDTNSIQKKAGYFGEDKSFIKEFEGKVDAILLYSVIQYIFIEGNIYEFLHDAISLLKPDGRLLIGDIPNFQKRQRFLDSDQGKAFVAKFKKDANNQFSNVVIHENNEIKIDDSVVFSILQRSRNFGCESYLLEQNDTLPFANRREDILIVKR